MITYQLGINNDGGMDLPCLRQEVVFLRVISYYLK